MATVDKAKRHVDRSREDPSAGLYEADFYSWARRQADLLRTGDLARADLANIAEEIETLGRFELSALRSSYRLVAMHLLKMAYQPSRQSESWRSTIVRERGTIEAILDDNPGLRPKRAEALAKAYKAAWREAASETSLPIETFPVSCPFTLDEVENHDVWPDPGASGP